MWFQLLSLTLPPLLLPLLLLHLQQVLANSLLCSFTRCSIAIWETVVGFLALVRVSFSSLFDILCYRGCIHLNAWCFCSFIQLHTWHGMWWVACNVNDVEKSCVDGYINIIMNDMVAAEMMYTWLCSLCSYATFYHFSLIWNLWLAKQSHFLSTTFFILVICAGVLIDKKNFQNCYNNFPPFSR